MRRIFLASLIFVLMSSFGKCKRQEEVKENAVDNFYIEGELNGSPIRLRGGRQGEKTINGTVTTSYVPPTFMTALGQSLVSGGTIFGLGGTGLFGLLAMFLLRKLRSSSGALGEIVEKIESLKESTPSHVQPVLEELDATMTPEAKAHVKALRRNLRKPLKEKPLRAPK